MLAKRIAMPHPVMADAGRSVARHFADHPILAFASSFAGYVAMRGELDVMGIFDVMARFRKRTALPTIEADKSLKFRYWKLGDPLLRNSLGAQEPLHEALEMAPAVVLVPLLAFDADGYRLGYGGGYYDRTMAAARSGENTPLFIGVGYAAQEVDQVPTDEFDVPLDGILTELGVSMFTF
jgi:5-formyltetrahydrofolate cyclo-ligase